jgi:hypothetical protein
MSTERFISWAVWLGGAGHFLLLGASVQAPGRLRWKSDLAKLLPFNRKLLWAYGGYIVGTYLAFGILTLLLHAELLRGDRAALALATFIGLYWLVRLVLDATYFSHEDWPPGGAFVVGHVLLDLLFAALTVIYLGLVAWRLWLH